jgi:hypothetical protein
VIHALTFATYAITLDGRTVLPKARAAVANGHVLLPVRALGNALGADVGYDGRAHTITVQRGARVATISARGAVRIVNGTAYAPLRAVATAFGLLVAYEPQSRTVALDDRTGELTRRANQDTLQRVNSNAPPPTPRTYAITVKPENGASVHDPYPAITARFAGATSIDPQSLHVTLDGRDVSAEAAVIGDQVLLTPRRALSPGTHYVSVAGRDVGGGLLAQQWSFTDDFAFVAMPAPTPYPVSAIWIDRWVQPGTNAFDVYVEGQPGMSGYIGVDGVPGIFPLQVYTASAYVAHVLVPSGVNQPFARVAARITLPNGTPQTLILPQTINLFTPVKPLGTAGYPTAIPTSHSAPRYPLSGSSTPTPTPRAVPPTPRPTMTPGTNGHPIVSTPRPLATPHPVATTTAHPVAPTPTPAAASRRVLSSPVPVTPQTDGTPLPQRRVPLARPLRTPVPTPKPTPVPTGTPSPTPKPPA